MVLSNYNTRNIHFSLKEYNNNYQNLLTEFLSIHEDFDEKQFIEYELDLYDLCLENATLTHYFYKGKNKYAVNFGNCRFIISKIYDNLVNFKDENDGWDLELALKYQASFKKIIDYLKRKKEILLDINSTRYNNLLNIAKTPEVKELLTNIFYKNITLFSVVNFIKEKTNDETHELFMGEFNFCFEMISNEFMFKVNEEDIKDALQTYEHNLEYVYVYEDELPKIKAFVREINNTLTVYNVYGLFNEARENTIKLVFLNNLMINYYDGFFTQEIEGFENISHLKYVYNYLNDIEYKQVSINNKDEILEPSYKKYPAKYHALTYIFELLIENQKPPSDPDGNFKKDEIIKLGKERCKDTGQSFYNCVKDHFENVSKNTIKYSAFKNNWKDVVLELSKDKEKINDYLKNNNL